MASEPTDLVVKPGQPVFDEEGNELGIIRGLTEEGFQVRTGEAVGHVDLEHDPGQGFGEGYLVWRCAECGEVGDLEDGLPETCPNCGAPKEDLYAWTED
ncbi:DUF7130 family rubredoxin-like protein [Halomarina ordinaria]|uniref:Rubredoxin-like domain-containing protein n=1 Tax=Halomarina ordinaria TaxID=3033939 RepID=A0ABD5U9A8_9EURY|nr:hypothetical protein [Halomarina sp. PSRA2]